MVQGQTLFHTSGDFGSFFACGQPAKYQRTTNVQPSIDETASSPDVTVVEVLSSLRSGGRTVPTLHVWRLISNMCGMNSLL